MRILFLCLTFFINIQVFASTADTTALHDKIIKELIPDSFQDVQAIDSSVHAQLLGFMLSNPKIVSALEQLKSFNNDTFSLDNLIHSSDPNIAKAAAYLRRFYLYVIYSHPIFSVITGYVPPKIVINKTDQTYPESHIQLKENELKFDGDEIDYLVIGSGPAGSLIASQLAQTKKILLIDAGPFVKPGSVSTEYDTELMESLNQRHTLSGGIAIRNGRAIGGGTTVNIDLAFSPELPSIREALNRWIKEGRLHPNFAPEVDKAYAWVKKTIGTRTVNYDEVNLNNRLLLKGSPTARPYELNAKVPTGLRGEILKISAVDAFLWPAMTKHSETLQVIPNLQVVDLKQENNKISEVTVKPTAAIEKEYIFKDPHNLQLDPTKTYKIRAKDVILCAGSLGSPEILLRSNIPNSNIGRGLVMHPSIGILGMFNQPICNMDGLLASVYATSAPLSDGYFFESMSADPSFIASIHPGTKEHIAQNLACFLYVGGFGVMLVDSVSNDNRVFVDSNGQVQVDYNLSKADMKRFRKAILEGIKILFERGALEVFIPSMERIYKDPLSRRFTSYKEAKKAIRKLKFKENLTVLSSAHMQATNKMGSDYRSSVVSLDFKVWNQKTAQEFSNLYVVDSSIFPTSIGANPMQSIYTFAKIFVDRLR